MKQQINEIRRMQQLAGLITESQLNEEFNLDTYFQKANKEFGWGFSENDTIDSLEYGDESWERKLAKKLMNIGEIPYEDWKIEANKVYNRTYPG
jgi:hypothetical protein